MADMDYFEINSDGEFTLKDIRSTGTELESSPNREYKSRDRKLKAKVILWSEAPLYAAITPSSLANTRRYTQNATFVTCPNNNNNNNNNRPNHHHHCRYAEAWKYSGTHCVLS